MENSKTYRKIVVDLSELFVIFRKEHYLDEVTTKALLKYLHSYSAYMGPDNDEGDAEFENILASGGANIIDNFYLEYLPPNLYKYVYDYDFIGFESNNIILNVEDFV